MMQLPIILVLIGMVFAANPGTLHCNDPSFNTQATCLASGYCAWSASTCSDYTLTTECYKIDEIGACRSGGIYATATLCSPLSSLNVQYSNVCGPNGKTTIDYNDVRFPIVTSGYPDYSLTGLTVAQLSAIAAGSKADYLYQVFSVNLQTATNTQLNAILDLYQAYSGELVKTTTHPYYIEKALFQTFQNIRDDTAMTPALKTATLGKFWTLAGTYLNRLRTFSKYYQTNYYILNFAQTTFSRLYLTVNGQSFTTTLSWTQYTSNGYVQVISYPPTQFGIASATTLSDVYFVKLITDASGATSTPYTTMSPLKVTYINSGGSVTITNTNSLKYVTDKAVSPHVSAVGAAQTSFDNTAKKLEFTLPASATGEYTFYIAV